MKMALNACDDADIQFENNEPLDMAAEKNLPGSLKTGWSEPSRRLTGDGWVVNSNQLSVCGAVSHRIQADSHELLKRYPETKALQNRWSVEGAGKTLLMEALQHQFRRDTVQ
jgi:hypothetical protein